MIVLAVTGVVRALSELGAVSQLWTTGYGRAILVKSALFAVLVVLGWMSRARVAAAIARLRTTVVAEIAVFLGVIVAVAFLTALPPGRRAQAAAEATPPAQPVRPPPDATVLAQKDGPIAATVAVRPAGDAIAGFIGTDGLPANVGDVRIDGAPTTSCGVGCYRGTARGRFVTVTHGTSTLRFDLGLRRPAADLVARATRTYRALTTVRYSETLSAGFGTVVRTVWTEVAPDRLSYTIADGAKGIIIGDRRWDLSPGETTVAGEPIGRPADADAAVGERRDERAPSPHGPEDAGRVLPRAAQPGLVHRHVRPEDAASARAGDDRAGALHAPALHGVQRAADDRAAEVGATGRGAWR